MEKMSKADLEKEVASLQTLTDQSEIKLSLLNLEKEEILNPEKAEKRRRRKKKARIMAVVTVICMILVVCCTGFIVVRVMSKATSPSPSLSTGASAVS